MVVNITDSAAKQIDEICKNTKKSIRLVISSGGCHGFNKNWELSEQVDSYDTIFPCINGQLVIDQSSLDIIAGATIDYKLDLKGSFFTVDVPHAISACSCGSSFSI